MVDDPRRLPGAPIVEPVAADRSGTVVEVKPRVIGHAIVVLGGGRSRADQAVDPAVGFRIPVKPGDRIDAGTPIGFIHARHPDQLPAARAALREAVVIGDVATPLPLIGHRVTVAGIEALT